MFLAGLRPPRRLGNRTARLNSLQMHLETKCSAQSMTSFRAVEALLQELTRSESVFITRPTTLPCVLDEIYVMAGYRRCYTIVLDAICLYVGAALLVCMCTPPRDFEEL